MGSISDHFCSQIAEIKKHLNMTRGSVISGEGKGHGTDRSPSGPGETVLLRLPSEMVHSNEP
jgi:hypothetical protein